MHGQVGSPTRSCYALWKDDSKHGSPVARMMITYPNLTCMLEAEESKRLRMEGTAPRIHEDHVAGKGSKSLHHHNLVHNFSNASSNENTCSKAALDTAWAKLKTIQRGMWRKSETNLE